MEVGLHRSEVALRVALRMLCKAPWLVEQAVNALQIVRSLTNDLLQIVLVHLNARRFQSLLRWNARHRSATAGVDDAVVGQF